MQLAEKIRLLLIMTKPTQLALLMVTMYGAYFAAGGGLDARTFLLLLLTGIGSAGGVTALNMYLEQDIDSVMERTRSRPLPSRMLGPLEAITGITILIVIGVVAASFINRWVMFTALVGLYFDIIAYTELFKRHTHWALLAGSVAGSMPALGGWAAGHGSISIEGLLLAGMVYVWQPLHVSFIHYAYSEDYEAAGIPTLHKGVGEKGYGVLSLASIIGLILLVWAFAALAGYGYVTATIATFMGLGAVRAAVQFLREPSRERARFMIKLASPILGIVFLFLPLEMHLAAVLTLL